MIMQMPSIGSIQANLEDLDLPFATLDRIESLAAQELAPEAFVNELFCALDEKEPGNEMGAIIRDADELAIHVIRIIDRLIDGDANLRAHAYLAQLGL